MEHFNPHAVIPYGVTTRHLCAAMNDFIEFIRMVNLRLNESGAYRLESMLMPANFSSMVGEFVSANLPRHSSGIVKNTYHNGHPDMLPAGRYSDDSLQHGTEGIEVKASRYLRGWQGHNAEDVWLMVFMYDSNRPVDAGKGGRHAMPFRFLRVAGARLEKSDWRFSGRSETSRRTITASVTNSGYQKMMANLIYNSPDLCM
ncbi:MAG: hypothetical protein H3C51_01620 [Rubellimicrobium sp.]|nr:hypothetical protein [Rubellimicrobium sp.]